MSGRKRSGGAAQEIDELLGGARPKGAPGKEKRGRAAPGPARPRLPQGRILAICLAFLAALAIALVRFADLAAEGELAFAAAAEEALSEEVVDRAKKPDAPRPGTQPRAPIMDRNGQPLARDLPTYELYLDADAFALHERKWPEVDEGELAEAAETIAKAFPGRFKAETILAKTRNGRTALVGRPLTAIEAQRAHNLGVPGLYLVRRIDRFYPAGALTAHAVGYVDIDGAGKAGVEAGLDARLREAPKTPLRLTLDLRAQRVVRAALQASMEETGAKAASGIVLDVESGEVAALVSLPDYDPHHRPPAPSDPKAQEESPLFFRSVIGQYELGSVLKVATWALALETGVAKMSDAYEALPPLKIDNLELAGERPMSFPLAFAKSSNRVAAELALQAGRRKQEALFKALGFFSDTPLEVGGASLSAQSRRSEGSATNTVTASYGYGVQISPLHMAAATATLVNGGERVTPTLLPAADREAEAPPLRVVSAETSRRVRELMRMAVEEGTGARAAAPGLRVGGKTGTAEKIDASGNYQKEGLARASFVGVFPIERPRYVVSVMLDEPTVMVDGKPSASAGRTAAPAARAIVEGVAPLLGVAPRPIEAARVIGAPELLPQPVPQL